MLARLRPYWLHAYLLAYCGVLLLADSRVTSLAQQYLLGVITFAALALCTLRIPAAQRRQVWLCVGVATCFEILGSLIWGIYRYRFHNLPLYVPAGHGLVYLFGLTAASTPLMRERARTAAWVVLALASAWALAGLTIIPHLTGRLDVGGAMLLPVFAWFVLRSPRASLFIAIFVATAELEIVGTSLATWAWLPAQPFTHIPSGNPPSVIAGGYCVIDGAVLLAGALLARLEARLRQKPEPLPGAAPAPVSAAVETIP